MNRIVSISNRVPVPRKNASAGGLATGVLAAMRGGGGLWFGWSGDTCAEGEAPPVAISHRDRIEFATVDLPAPLASGYYDGFSNGALWPLFHYFIGRFRYASAEYAAYCEVNALLAERLVPLLTPRDLLWIHDYHLIPLAAALRSRGVTQPIGLFFHIPFPHVEVLRALPVHAELLRMLLACDVIGFQTETDRQSFLACLAVLGGDAVVGAGGTVRYEGRRIATGVFPIGVDVDAVAHSAVDAHSTDLVQRMVRGLLGRKLVIGVDRLDYSKGLVERFAAYEQFLDGNPEQRGRVTYLQIAPLSRTSVQSYAEIRRALEQAAGRTNGRFADADWTPIRYLNRDFPHGAMMGFLRAADACLVTPVRDGMNLVAKEFIAAQDPEDPGVLVLSRMAGAAVELTDALLVNPFDAQGVARALHQALTMPLAERRRRHARLLDVLRAHDIVAWQRGFVEALRRSAVAPLPHGLPERIRTVRPAPWLAAP